MKRILLTSPHNEYNVKFCKSLFSVLIGTVHIQYEKFQAKYLIVVFCVLCNFYLFDIAPEKFILISSLWKVLYSIVIFNKINLCQIITTLCSLKQTCPNVG